MYYQGYMISLHSSTGEGDDEEEHDQDDQDDQQNLIKKEKVHSKRTESSQLVQEEKAETGSVCDKMQIVEYQIVIG